jgi:glycine hydroxymethyltransferase
MGDEEMAEIASIIHRVLGSTSPAVISSGKNAGSMSKAKYSIEPAIAAEAKERVGTLLSRYPVYPELDLNFMQKAFLKEKQNG